MRTVLAPRKADDVTLLQHTRTPVRAQRRLAAEHDHPFLVQVVGVVGPELVARLDLGHGRADELTADALANKRALDAPALAVPRAIPLVAVEVESLHSMNGRLRLKGHSLRFWAIGLLARLGFPLTAISGRRFERKRLPNNSERRAPVRAAHACLLSGVT